MFDQSMIIENFEDRFNQLNISFRDESYINNIIDNDIDVNEDEMLALYFIHKSEETNNKIQNISEEIEKTDKNISFIDNSDINVNITKDKIQNISEEIEKTDKKISFIDNSDIDFSYITKERIQNMSIEIEKTDKKINSKDSSDIDAINITKDKIQNISEEIEKTDKKINSQDISDIDDSYLAKDRSTKSIEVKHKKKADIKIIRKYEKKIFKIVKIKKINNKKGRLLKNAKKRYYYRYHDKFKEDNIIKKIKISFIGKTMNYINKEYGIYLNQHKIKKIGMLIKRIAPNISTRIKKENNLKWFDSKLKDIFSDNISSKYSKFNGDYNKKQIEQIYKEDDAKNMINILDKKVRDMYYIYSKNIKLEGFLTLEDDLRIQRELMKKNNEEEVDKYLKKFQNIAQNLEQIFMRKRGRNYNKNNNMNSKNI